MTNQNATAPQADNLLGICHALGETFGFNPLFLRIALLIAVMINAEATLITYLVAGIAVAIAKLATRRSGHRAKTLSLTNA